MYNIYLYECIIYVQIFEAHNFRRLINLYFADPLLLAAPLDQIVHTFKKNFVNLLFARLIAIIHVHVHVCICEKLKICAPQKV